MDRWIKYWRNSLIDYSRMSIDLKNIDKDSIEINQDDITNGLDPNTIKKLFDKTEDEILIMISPIILRKKTNHGLKKDLKYCPYWIPCNLHKDGKVSPPISSSLYPWFVRDVVEPNGNDLFPDISDVETIDRTLDKYEFTKHENIEEYLQMSLNFFKEITGKTYSNYKVDGFYTESKVFAVKGKNSHMTVKALIEGYDHVLALESKFRTKLLKKITNSTPQKIKSIKPDKELYLEGYHVAQMSAEFPLSRTQRTSCSLYFNKKDNGEILAINGPPGTGKTTLLQTVLANTIVEAVVLGKEQIPLTVAMSTNNQAITNILDSFSGVGGEDEFTRRWLPNINSLGLYFVSSSRETEAKEDERPYINKRGEGIFSEIETEEYYSKAKVYYLEKYKNIVGKKVSKIDECIKILRNKVLYNTIKQKTIINAYKEYLKTESPEKDLIELKMSLEKAIERKAFFQEIQNDFSKYYKDASIIHRALPFTRSSKLKIEWINSKVFKEIDTTDVDITNRKELDTLLASEIRKYEDRINLYEKQINKIKKIKVGVDKAVKDFTTIKNELDKLSFEKIEKLYNLTGEEYKDVEIYEDLSIKMDLTYRSDAYNWAIHYWEAIFLRELRSYLDREDKNEFSYTQYRTKLSRWAMVFPCFISTSYTLPSIAFNYGWTKPYFGIFDQMIVDEAGQVCAEIGALSFAYAKRAIVVGDTKQIEPIWTINRHIDKSNLTMVGLANSDDEFLELSQSGLLASSGSLMKLAQNASVYKDVSVRGYSLKEHRRCLDEIIYFSEKYVYKGALIPKVGRKNYKCIPDFPSIGYFNIDGKKRKKYGSSCNEIEANTIVKWLLEYKNKIEDHYGKKIGHLLAIVTPFSAQKKVINTELKKVGLVNENITVGTVHALQGAERSIILFSPVYSDPNESYFFDSNYNMLNVAISRAKHNFFVFGKMKIFNPSKSSPSGDLAKVLFTDPENQLGAFHNVQSVAFRDDTIHVNNRISTLDKHRRTLIKVINDSTERLVIISPFISINAIESDDLISKLSAAIYRGVDVTILSDKYLDAPRGKLKVHSEKGRNELKKIGVNLKIIQGVHQKSILMDNRVLIEGSFNWLSAVRDESSPYFRKEVSYIITEDIDPNFTKYVKEFEEEFFNL